MKNLEVNVIDFAPAEMSEAPVVNRRRKRRRVPILILAVSTVLVVFILAAFLAPWAAAHDPAAQNLRARLQPPGTQIASGATYVLGTDHLGRDVLSRIIYGARTSLVLAASSVLVSILLGVAIGSVAGYFGGVVDSILMRLADIQLAFPYILIAIVVIGLLGPTLRNIIVVLGVANWVLYARMVRGEVLVLREREFVEAAHAIGARAPYLFLKHILPALIPTITILVSFNFASVIVAEAGLSFLALGVPPGTPSWGGMLADGRAYVDTAWWLSVFPGIAIILLVVSTNLVGDYMRDRYDPYLRTLG